MEKPTMNYTGKIRKLIQQELLENYKKSKDLVDKNPIKLKNDNSGNLEVIGDPFEVKLNQNTKLNDEHLVGAVGVKAGGKSVGKDSNAGQTKPNFTTKKPIKK